VVNADDLVILTTNSREGGFPEGLGPGAHRLQCRLPAHLFNTGELRLNVILGQRGRMLLRVEDAVAFTVMEPPRTRDAWQGRRKGMFRLVVPWGASVPA